MRPVPKSNLCGQFKRQLTKLTAKLNLNLYLSKRIQPHDWHIIDSTWLSTINTRIHEGESANDFLVVTWSGLWCFLFIYYLVHPEQETTRWWTGHSHAATSNTLPWHTITNKQSIWKHRKRDDYPHLVGRGTHTNFSKLYRCSGLGITYLKQTDVVRPAPKTNSDSDSVSLSAWSVAYWTGHRDPYLNTYNHMIGTWLTER